MPCRFSEVGENSADEHAAMKAAVRDSGLDARYMLAVLFQESAGCVRVRSSVSPMKVSGTLDSSKAPIAITRTRSLFRSAIVEPLSHCSDQWYVRPFTPSHSTNLHILPRPSHRQLLMPPVSRAGHRWCRSYERTGTTSGDHEERC